MTEKLVIFFCGKKYSLVYVEYRYNFLKFLLTIKIYAYKNPEYKLYTIKLVIYSCELLNSNYFKWKNIANYYLPDKFPLVNLDTFLLIIPLKYSK